jgi:LacI family transcriptional regulator
MSNPSQTTLKTISKIVGCSDTTVSRVLNGKAIEYRISQKKADEILSVAQELNFSPNALARSLRTRQTLTIGLVIPDISNPFFASIARYVERECRKIGYSVILADTEESTELEIESISVLKSRNIDGMIISPVGQSVDHLEALYAEGVPIVVIDRYVDGSTLPFVASDNYNGAKNAVSHLIEHGHRTIACIQGLPYTSPNTDRVKGYRDALQQSGIDLDDSLIVGDSFGEENGYLETKLLLKRTPKPTAIFAVSNLISLGALRALKDENMSIPEDISIVVFDEQPYHSYLATPMTTVAQPIADMGQIAIKMLYKQMKSDTKIDHGIVLPTHLMVRQSVKFIRPIEKQV